MLPQHTYYHIIYQIAYKKGLLSFHMTVLPISSCPKAFILCIHLISITFCRESSLEARLLYEMPIGRTGRKKTARRQGRMAQPRPLTPGIFI